MLAGPCHVLFSLFLARFLCVFCLSCPWQALVLVAMKLGGMVARPLAIQYQVVLFSDGQRFHAHFQHATSRSLLPQSSFPAVFLPAPPRPMHRILTMPSARCLRPGHVDRARRPAPKSRSFSISRRSTRRPTPARTSTSTRAATGSRTIPIPSTETRWGRFNELGEYNQDSLYRELKAAADAPKTPLQVKYGNYYAACMNTTLADSLGAKPIMPELHGCRPVDGQEEAGRAGRACWPRATARPSCSPVASARTRRTRASRFCRPARAA